MDIPVRCLLQEQNTTSAVGRGILTVVVDKETTNDDFSYVIILYTLANQVDEHSLLSMIILLYV